ncbi:MAG TPA: GNAT family N-acetyltransferase [Verrucomicrobiales bacterium]|nr:GNAT family N-acetyltransferase [Verrucomicrobiales bacterium]
MAGAQACIRSERLDLIPMTPAFLRASLEGNRTEAEEVLRIGLPADWPGEFSTVLALRLEQLEGEPGLQPWLLRAMTVRGSRAMVGSIGFHSAPGPQYLTAIAPGAVEFGFSVFPPFRGRGYAYEASVALMRWARKDHRVAKFVLSIRPDNMASQGLAAKLGFVRTGFHVDEIDGVEDILEYRAPEDEEPRDSQSVQAGTDGAAP